jgi:hypothetical protein
MKGEILEAEAETPANTPIERTAKPPLIGFPVGRQLFRSSRGRQDAACYV